MRKISLLSCVVLSLSLVACEDSEFSGATAAAETYTVKSDDSIASGAPDAGQSTTGKGPDAGQTPDADQAACAAATGVDAKNIKVSGSTKDIVVNSQQALALKVTGNQNSLLVDLKGQAADARISAICLFIAGNQNNVKIDVAGQIGAIYVKARGNRPLVEVVTVDGSKIDKIEMDAKGNGGILALSGDGTFPCDKSNTSIVCK